jgi:hypothetical protein
MVGNNWVKWQNQTNVYKKNSFLKLELYSTYCTKLMITTVGYGEKKIWRNGMNINWFCHDKLWHLWTNFFDDCTVTRILYLNVLWQLFIPQLQKKILFVISTSFNGMQYPITLFWNQILRQCWTGQKTNLKWPMHSSDLKLLYLHGPFGKPSL